MCKKQKQLNNFLEELYGRLSVLEEKVDNLTERDFTESTRCSDCWLLKQYILFGDKTVESSPCDYCPKRIYFQASK